MSNNELKKKTLREFIIVKTIIDKWDPISLLDFAPDDEYNIEIEEITLHALKPLSDNALGEKIFSVFTGYFGSVFNAKLLDCIQIAEEINKVLNTKPCIPVKNDIVNISDNQITEINNTGIKYFDSSGKEGFVDFVSCRQNWINHVINSGEFHNTANDFMEKTKCVAIRDITLLFFEFHSEPKIRIQIEVKHTFMDYFKINWKNRYYKRFREIQNKISAAGWSTFDIS